MKVDKLNVTDFQGKVEIFNVLWMDSKRFYSVQFELDSLVQQIRLLVIGNSELTLNGS